MDSYTSTGICILRELSIWEEAERRTNSRDGRKADHIPRESDIPGFAAGYQQPPTEAEQGAGCNHRQALTEIEDCVRVSPWHNLKQDSARPTAFGVRELLARYDQLSDLARYSQLLKPIPLEKMGQWALERNSLDAASMADLSLGGARS